MLLQSLYFSRPPPTPPPPPTRAIIPDARPLGTFENQDVAVIACSAGVFWVGETLFVFVILL